MKEQKSEACNEHGCAQVVPGEGSKNVALVWGKNSDQGASPQALLAKRGSSRVIEGLQAKIRGLNCDLKRKGG